jgi:N-acetylneuraminic acid mutarotase
MRKECRAQRLGGGRYGTLRVAASGMLKALMLAVWLPLAPIQIARQEVAVAEAGGRVYVIGGIGNGTTLSSVEEYDPLTDTWRFVAPLPQPLHHPAAASTGDAIYVIGGYPSLTFTPTAAVYRYDVAGDRWTRIADLPRPRAAMAAAAIDGKIYAAGGLPGGRDLTVYDPLTDRWTTLASLTVPREHHAAVAAGGKLYVAGGRFGGNTGAFESYDPATDRWTLLPPLPTPRSGIAAAFLGGRIHVFGGEGNPDSPFGVFAENESYDLLSGTWRSEPPMATPRHGIGAAATIRGIVIPAGSPVEGFGTTAITDAFVPDPPPRRRSVGH